MSQELKSRVTGTPIATPAVSLPQQGILVIEDDPDLQWIIARSLTLRGNRVVGTSSGEGALALMAEWPVDLVLVDEALPGMSGIELARRVRESYPSVPVVLMSERRGYPEPTGVSAIVEKPLRVEAILAVLRSLLGRLTFPPPE